MITKDQVIKELTKNKKQLQELQIKHLRIFGSVAKWTQNSESDLDLLYEYDEDQGKDRWIFTAYQYIYDKLWISIDLIDKDMIKENAKSYILDNNLVKIW